MGQIGRRQFLIATGALLAASPVLAQQRAKLRRIGVLALADLGLRSPFWTPLFAGLARHGWHEGVEFTLLLKEARGDPTQVGELARELAGQRVDVVLAITTAPALAAMRASDQIPIVTWCGYPVEAGLAASLARPGGNVTGVALYASSGIWGKYVELLRELRPGLSELGVLFDYAPPAFPDGPVAFLEIQRAAKQMGINSRLWLVRSEQDLAEAISAVDRGPIEALVISSGGGVHVHPPAMERIGNLVARRQLVAITDTPHRVFAGTGCVLAYSADIPEILGRLAYLIDRILRGASPGELPFELPSRFNLTISAKAAKVIGITIPPSIMLRADRVIE